MLVTRMATSDAGSVDVHKGKILISSDKLFVLSNSVGAEIKEVRYKF